jgi:hypothetical protein
VVALVGVLVYFLELEKRTERTAIHNSRVVVLVDTSLSMGLQDSERGPAQPESEAANRPTRLDQVVSVLDRGGLIERLRAVHDVVLVRFDAEMGRRRSPKSILRLPRRNRRARKNHLKRKPKASRQPKLRKSPATTGKNRFGRKVPRRGSARRSGI